MAGDDLAKAKEAALHAAAAIQPEVLRAAQVQQHLVAQAARYEPQVVRPPLKTIADANLASEFYSRLVDWISRFDESLDPESEVGVRLVSFGQTVTFHLEDMGYRNPSLISFKGLTEEGDPVELIQHVAQISVLLVKMKRRDPSRPKQPIGFAPPPMGGEGESA